MQMLANKLIWIFGENIWDSKCSLRGNSVKSIFCYSPFVLCILEFTVSIVSNSV